jgi:hypothetical protein
VAELTAANNDTLRELRELYDPSGELWLFRSHHTTSPYDPDLRSDFLLALDGGAAPGVPRVLAIHLDRDFAIRTVRAALKRTSSLHLAQEWLVERGADAEQIQAPEGWNDPADPQTAAVQDLLTACGEHYAVHDSFRSTSVPYDIWVIAADQETPNRLLPIVVFHWSREGDDPHTYTVRVGQFATIEDAYEWTRDTSRPMPHRTSSLSQRTEAARILTRATARNATATGPGQSLATAPRPARSR